MRVLTSFANPLCPSAPTVRVRSAGISGSMGQREVVGGWRAPSPSHSPWDVQPRDRGEVEEDSRQEGGRERRQQTSPKKFLALPPDGNGAVMEFTSAKLRPRSSDSLSSPLPSYRV